MNLWQSDNERDWQAALTEYPTVIRAQQVRGLAELDAWYREDFPARLVARRTPYITHAELERVTLWKMKRGVWRERNRLLVTGNDPATVRKTSRQAFAAVPDVKKPIMLFCALDGVGPATASAVLAAYSPALFPFFDELVAHQIPGLGPVAFTAPYYQRYAAELRDHAAKLNARGSPRTWTAQMLSQALWASSGGKIAQVSKADD